jgi:hypothetical protein
VKHKHANTTSCRTMLKKQVQTNKIWRNTKNAHQPAVSKLIALIVGLIEQQTFTEIQCIFHVKSKVDWIAIAGAEKVCLQLGR